MPCQTQLITGQTRHLIIHCLYSRVSTAFKNQKAIELETRKLQLAIHKHDEQTNTWLSLLNDFNDALKVGFITIDKCQKELGNVPNAIEVIERDLNVVTHVRK